MDMENQKAELLRKLSNVACIISGLDCVCSRRYTIFVSAVGRLGPLFKELEEIREQISENTVNALRLFEKALDMARNLARLMRCECKLYAVLSKTEINNEFEKISDQFRTALYDISYRKLNIPDDVKDQVWLAHRQFGTLNPIFGTPDMELCEDMSYLYNQINDVDTDDGTLSKLCRNLLFWEVEDVKRESQALEKVMNMKKGMSIPGYGNLEENEKNMSVLLNKLESFLESRTVPDDFCCPISLELMRDPVIVSSGKTFDRAFIEKCLPDGYGKCPLTRETLFRTSLTSNCALQSLIRKWQYISGMEPLEKFGKSLSKLTFDKMEQEFGIGEFVCYFSESQQPDNCQKPTKLMKDPVIICTGQTYDRASIEKWLKAGRRTCPLTNRILSSTSLIPNHALYSLISNWCEVNGLKPFKRSSSSDQGMVVSTDYADEVRLEFLLGKLNSDKFEDRRSAAEEICYHAMHSYNTVMPVLVKLLSSPDTDTQKHAITTLRELSFEVRDSRHHIISSNAVPGILHVLENGSMEARKDAALTFWSLSTSNEYRKTLGASGAIQALVKQLRDGSHWEKIASARALSELCKYEGNQGLAISVGVVSMLLGELTVTESCFSMVDTALDVMKLLVSHPDGIAAIRDCRPVPVLLELLMIGSPRNKEIVLAILRKMKSLLGLDNKQLPEAKELHQILFDLNVGDDIVLGKAEEDYLDLFVDLI